MGCGASSEAGERPEITQAQLALDDKIDTLMEEQQRTDDLKIKLLLLGAGESGKSTIFKQMRIIYGSPRTDEDLRMFGVVIRSNIITVTRKLCQLIQLGTVSGCVCVSCEYMREVWKKRSYVNIIDGHKEFLDSLERIASPSFKPTQQDLLLARVKTTQVNMERYKIDNIEFEMYDVGGQRSERRKWIDCFDSVDAVIFVAALSEFDQNLAESKRTNRMVEALELFRTVCNNRAFANTSVLLFLNKKDVFEEKLQYSDIAAQKPFADYDGPPNDLNNGIIYFIEKFKDCLINDEMTDSFIQPCTATDTNNMEFVLDSTRTIIMTDNLRRSGFLGAG
eukprot:jgi/Psemu1/208507/e_gw1.471.5.1